MTSVGTFVLALHSHLPYCRGAGRWPHGEEWIHEAVLGTYLPLLVLLHDLRDAGVPYRIVIGLRSSKRLLGLEPTGIWLPECAYAPGLETVLEEHGITHFFTDAALLPGHAQPALAGSRRRGHSELRRAPPHEARVATALAPE